MLVDGFVLPWNLVLTLLDGVKILPCHKLLVRITLKFAVVCLLFLEQDTSVVHRLLFLLRALLLGYFNCVVGAIHHLSSLPHVFLLKVDGILTSQ